MKQNQKRFRVPVWRVSARRSIDGLKASVEDFQATVGVSPEEVMSLVLLTQYFDALRDIGQHSNTILFPHSPGAVGDLFSQIRNVITVGTLAASHVEAGEDSVKHDG